VALRFEKEIEGYADLKVVTWNQGYWQHRSTNDEARNYLRNQIRPDLALLQEVGPTNLHSDEYFTFKKVHQNWGTALYTRNMPLEELAIAEEYPGRVSAVSFEIRLNQKAIAVSVHAPIIEGRVFPHLDRIFDEIERMVGGKTFIVGGDLNTARLAEKVWPRHGHGPFFERISKSIFFDCHQAMHGREEQTIFRKGSKYPFQDDHLFVSHDLASKVKSCFTLDNEIVRSLSDHIPIVAHLLSV
jgi:exonuclease III